MRQSIRGLVVCIAVAFVSALLGDWLALDRVMTSLLVGMLLGQLTGTPAALAQGLAVAEKHVLAMAVILLGAKLHVGDLVSLGLVALGAVFASVVVALLGARLLAPRFGLTSSQAVLLGVGSAICGGSAIAGAAPIIRAERAEIGTSIAAVNFVGTVGMILLPLLVVTKIRPESEVAYLSGATLHAVGHVTAAGYSLSQTAGDLATTLKLGRVALLAPVLLVLAAYGGKGSTGSRALPLFVPGFLLLMLGNSFSFFSSNVVGLCTQMSTWLLCVAMVAIGWRTQWRELRTAGPRSILVVALLWVMQVLAVGLVVGGVGG
ncbi:MAG: YeiH family protein [Myxococcota bacterium]